MKNPRHGHLHVSKKFPIFHCFRCGAKGFIERLETQINEKCKHHYTYSISYDLPCLNVPLIKNHMDSILQGFSVAMTDPEINYFCERCRCEWDKFGILSANQFSLLPDNVVRQMLPRMRDNTPIRTWAVTFFGSVVNGRAHVLQEDTLRYKTEKIPLPWSHVVKDDAYVIRTKYIGEDSTNTLVISEGVYDIVPLYLSRRKYRIPDNAMFSAALCATYSRCLKVFRLIHDRLPKEIIIFADKGIRLNNLKSQFSKELRPGVKVRVNYPMIKDWNEVGPVNETINLF